MTSWYFHTPGLIVGSSPGSAPLVVVLGGAISRGTAADSTAMAAVVVIGLLP